MSANSLTIDYRPIGAVKAYASNPRMHTRRQRAKLTSLLRRFGQLTPVIIDKANVIVDGHAVVEAMQALGETQVAVVVCANRDPSEIRAIRLALNRIPAEAGWDRARLKLEFEALIELGFEMELTGFDALEIDTTLEIGELGRSALAHPPLTPQNVPAVAQSGDVWALGDLPVARGDGAAMLMADPATIDVILRRWEMETGRQPQLLSRVGERSLIVVPPALPAPGPAASASTLGEG